MHRRGVAVSDALSTTILPTHTCFDDAIEYLSWRIQMRASDASRLFLVHAICLVPQGPRTGEPFAHAWVEEEMPGVPVVAWQDGFLQGKHVTYSMLAEELRAAFHVQESTRYTPAEAHAENQRTMTFGPWLDRYQSLCGRGTREVFL
jgi:hypothetical protein